VEDKAGEVTRLLDELQQGNRLAEDRLISIVYTHLKKIAAGQLRRERPDHSLQPTALVHEAYLRLIKIQDIDWEGRSHFFRISATVMRRILVDQARANQARKRDWTMSRAWLYEQLAPLLIRPTNSVRLPTHSPGKGRMDGARGFSHYGPDQ
jgi:hypothetical protein